MTVGDVIKVLESVDDGFGYDFRFRGTIGKLEHRRRKVYTEKERKDAYWNDIRLKEWHDWMPLTRETISHILERFNSKYPSIKYSKIEAAIRKMTWTRLQKNRSTLKDEDVAAEFLEYVKSRNDIEITGNEEDRILEISIVEKIVEDWVSRLRELGVRTDDGFDIVEVYRKVGKGIQLASGERIRPRYDIYSSGKRSDTYLVGIRILSPHNQEDG